MVGIRLDDADFRGTIGANGNVACVMDAKQSQHEHSGGGGAAAKQLPAAPSGKKHPWLVPVLPNAAEQRAAREKHGGTPPPSPSARLVFFPWGGGGPSACQSWVMPLAYQGIELMALSLPGRSARMLEVPVGDMRKVVDAVMAELGGLMDKPVALFGHSVGAIVAFEVAKQCLSRGGAAPFLLIASGHCAPHVHDGERYGAMHKLSDDALAIELEKWGALPHAVLQQPEMLALVLPALRADFELTEALEPCPTPVPIALPMVVLTGDADELVSTADAMDWRLHTLHDDVFQAKVFPGGHFFLTEHATEVLVYVNTVLRGRLDVLETTALATMTKWNESRHVPDWPQRESLIHTMCLEEPAVKWPKDLALTYRTERLTFSDLNEQADVLARFLRVKMGVGPDVIVGIFMEHCPQFVVAYYGIMKAGGAYMTLNLSTSPNVLEQQASNARCACVLTTTKTAGLGKDAPSIRVVNMDATWTAMLAVPAHAWTDPGVTADNLSFCGSSSGSTGAPKAMVAPHRTAVASNYWRQVRYPIARGDSVANHIFLTWEITHPHYAGVPMHLIDDETIYDPEALLGFLHRVHCTQILFTPSLMQNILDSAPAELLALGMSYMKQVLLCGEVVNWKLVRRLEGLSPQLRVFSEYSIAEIGTVTMGLITEPPPGAKRAACPVGIPDPNVDCWLLDEELRPVPLGCCGELYVGGNGLGAKACYLNKPELTAERYPLIPEHLVPGAAQRGERMFRTGDGGRFLLDGQLELVGRVAFMVKLRGYSIVPLAVETAMCEHPGVQAAVVAVKNGVGGEQLVGYYVASASAAQHSMDTPSLRAFLQDKVAAFEVPSTFTRLAEFPLGLTGKIDMKQLPDPPAVGCSDGRALSDAAAARLLSDTENLVLAAWTAVLPPGAVDATMLDANFFDLGGHSLMVAKVCKAINERRRSDLLPADLFQFSTIRSLASRVDAAKPRGGMTRTVSVPAFHMLEKPATPQANDQAPHAPVLTSLPSVASQPSRAPVAIIGLSCRFPGAADPETFYRKLLDGVESITFSTPEQLDEHGVDPTVSRASNYVPAAAVLEHVTKFDAALFGMSRMEAALTDPQHRQLLLGAWEAAECAGYLGARPPRGTAYYCGTAMSTYYSKLLSSFVDSGTQNERALLIEVGTDKDYAAHRVSYQLDLTGPSVCVQTSCSTALSCVALACADLHAEHSDYAIAAAASILFPQARGYLYHDGMPESRTGHCCTFDADACGTMFGDGTGTVMLRCVGGGDHDHAHAADSPLALLVGYGINNDGCRKASFNAPSVPGQRDAVVRALRHAAATPKEMSFVECHGTATVLGDPIEVAALAEAFAAGSQTAPAAMVAHCALGALKPNFAHSNIAAGMGGITKMVMALGALQLPGQINFKQLNPHIMLQSSPFVIQRQRAAWALPKGGSGQTRQDDGHNSRPRHLAGMTCLGMGGTNVHMLIHESLVAQGPAAPSMRMGVRRSPSRLSLVSNGDGSNGHSHDALSHQHEDPQLIVLSAHSATALVRMCCNLRRCMEAPPSDLTLANVALTLQRGRRQLAAHRFAAVCHTPAALVAALGHAEVETEAERAFTSAPTRRPTAALLLPGVADVRWLAPETATAAAAPLRTLMAREPTFRDAMRECAAALQQATGGVGALLCAVCGGSSGGRSVPAAELFAVEYSLGRMLQAAGVAPALLVAHGAGEWVSAALAGVLEPAVCVACLAAEDKAAVAALLRNTTLCSPAVRILSKVANGYLSDDAAQDPEHWLACHQAAAGASQAAAWAVPANLGSLGLTALLECGGCCRATTTALTESAGGLPIWRLLGDAGCARHEVAESYLHALQRLWLSGAQLEWAGLGAAFTKHSRRVQLPRYPFEGEIFGPNELREKFKGSGADAAVDPPSRRNLPPAQRLCTVAEWLSVPSFARAGPLVAAEAETTCCPRRVLLLGGSGSGAEAALAMELMGAGHEVDIVEIASERVALPGGFGVRDGSHLSDDLGWVLRHLPALPQQVVHCLGLSVPVEHGVEQAERAAAQAWHWLVALGTAIGSEPSAAAHYTAACRLDVRVVGVGLFSVLGEPADPFTSLLLGPAMVIPQENPSITVQVIDVREGDAAVARALTRELSVTPAPADKLVALRPAMRRGVHPHRWRLDYSPLVPRASECAAGQTLLRASKVTLITGGLGRIGLALASSLLECGDGAVVLTTRGTFPLREHWQELLATDSAHATAASQKLRLIEPLWRAHGERIHVQGNVAVHDTQCMIDVLDSVRVRVAPVDGVMHMAGLADLKYVAQATPETLANETQPKLRGVLALEEALRSTAPEVRYVVLFSSMAAILGGYGMAAYASANCFMDTFVREKAAQREVEGGGTMWKAANWDDWAFEYGKEQTAAYELTGTAAFAIQPHEGFHALQYVLGCGAPQVLVSPRALAPRVAQWLHHRSLPTSEPSAVVADIPAAAPAEVDLERIVLDQFRKMIMDETMAPDTSLFDAGGDSLLAAELLVALKATVPPCFLPELSMRTLLTTPSPAGLSAVLRSAVPSAGNTAAVPTMDGAALERLLLQEFRRVLMDGSIDATTDFFDAGGDSLMVAELLVALRSVVSAEALTRPLTLQTLFEHTSPARLAVHLGGYVGP